MKWPEADQFRCDNYPICGEVTYRLQDLEATVAKARMLGWHIYDGHTRGGSKVTWVLGPVCVGAHRRATSAPQVLPGQIPLF